MKSMNGQVNTGEGEEQQFGHALQILLRRQRAAFLKDMYPSYTTRVDRLKRIERLLDRHGEQFSKLISQDFGNRSRIETAAGELLVIRSAVRHSCHHLKSWMKPRWAPTSLLYFPGRSKLLRQPLGVVGIISPWNYPLQLTVMPLIDALAAGNRAMIKPSESTPLFAEALKARIAQSFAEDEVTIVVGGADVGEAFASTPFDHLVFTGSTAVGRLVAQAAAKNLTPVTLELGGKSPALIDLSCDLPQAVKRLAWGKLFSAGQSCIAPDYALVPRPRVEEFVDALQECIPMLYPSFQANPDYTSIVSEFHYVRLQGLLEDARACGARIIELNPTNEMFDNNTRKFPPALLLEVSDDMRVMKEEIFGPLLPIIAYNTLEEAIEYINQHDRPLALYWFGTDRANRDRVLEKTISGNVTINDTMLHIAQDSLPFGGVGASGYGQYHGEHGFRQFSKEKGVFIQGLFSAARILYPPHKGSTGTLLRFLSRLA
jgi:coniferyl-aldehyde dehydrogenase